MRAILCGLTAVALFAAASHACAQDVGRVLLAAGEAVAVRGNQTVTLALGSAVQQSDVLRTGPASNLQVRFIDESILSLRENSELRIEEFRFSGKEDGSERAFFRLVRGGLRTISGLVGRTNQKNYGLNSVVTSIGIRGSDFSARLCQKDCVKADGTLEKDGQFGSVHGPSHGTNRIIVNNEAEPDGKLFGMNEHFYVADAKSVIERLLVPPEVVANRLGGRGKPTTKPEGTGNEQTASGGAGQDSRGTTEPGVPPTPSAFIATENRDASGSPSVVGGSPTIAGVGAFFNSSNLPNEPSAGGGFFATTDVTTEPAGGASNLATPQKLLAFTIRPGFAAETDQNSTPVSASASSSASVIDETGPPNAIGAHWGRWTSGSFTTEHGNTHAITASNQFHYLYGPLAPAEVIAAKSGVASMQLVGGTTPTNDLGATGTFTGNVIGINFTTRAVNFPAITLNFLQQAWSFAPSASTIEFVAGAGAFVRQSVAGTCAGSNCSATGPGSATLGATGIFMGGAGDHLGVAFQTRASSGGSAAQTTQLYRCNPAC